jgi:nitrogen fixation/metabolism regulation signal transduction histidine kinase
MVFSRFIWSILAFVAAIVGSSILLGIYLQRPEFPVTRSLLIVSLVLETVLLFWYLTRIRRDLLKLINALSNDDPTMQFSRVRNDPYFSAIHKGFNALIKDFRLVRLDKEVEQRFFEATVNHVSFGLMAYDQQGNVEMVNASFLDLFKLQSFRHIRELEEKALLMPKVLEELNARKESLHKLLIEGQQYHLIFLSSKFRLKDKEITLISVRDISREIDQNELEAWQKLMRILRHEILNSLSPIKLLSTNLSEMPLPKLSEEEVRDMKTGLDTINRRATGLTDFLDTYSNLYRVPELEYTHTRVTELFQRIHTLHKDSFSSNGILCRMECEDASMELRMDERMIEQVFINLIKNALEALMESSHPVITLSAKESGKETVLVVKDNGKGIPDDQLDHIFIPFYSTREEGSGVGLSFSQHIMRMHHGRIHVQSREGEGTEIQLVFPGS